MKNLLLVIFSFVCLSTTAQEFNRWALEGDFGLHAIGDESADLRDQYNHFGVGLRYNINPKFGLGVSYGKDNLSLVNFDGAFVNTEYNRYNLEAFVDIFDVLDLQNNFITFLGHGGGGISTIDAEESDYYQSVFNMRGGLTALIKLSRSLALKLDASTTVNIGQDRTLDGNFEISNAGINSTVDNLSAGLVVYLGKKGKNGQKRQHADWVKPEPIAPIVQVIENTPVINKTEQYTINLNYKPVEFVYFENDLDTIDIQGLNAIEKVFVFLQNNPDAKVELTGSASPTQSTTVDYDMDLSERRVEKVKSKLIKLGLDPSRIQTGFIGKFNDRDDLHEFARRVSLMVVK